MIDFSNYLAQAFPEAYIAERNRNLYQKIHWDINTLTPYQVDQAKKEIIFDKKESNQKVHCQLDFLGTFNFDDHTFLWADENPSMKESLFGKCRGFREKLPAGFNHRKFDATVDLNRNLLSAFCYVADGEGSFYVRQGNTMIYFIFTDVRLVDDKSGNTKTLARPQDDFEEVYDMKEYISVIQEFHQEQYKINEQYYASGEINFEEAFTKLEEVHLKFWKNEDTYHYPSLSWPFDYEKTSDWQVVRMLSENRLFVAFSADRGYTMHHVAYEIDEAEPSKRCIINQTY